MSACCDSWCIWYKSVLTGEALVQHSPEPTIYCIPVVKSVQIVPAHLIYYNSNYKLWSFNFFCIGLGINNATKKQEEDKGKKTHEVRFFQM